MAEPFTIRIFVPDGNPENVLIVDRLNWTGLGIKFSKLQWLEHAKMPELTKPGIYMLIGEQDGDQEDELPKPPRLYIGQAEKLGSRINRHNKRKEFWDWGIAFTCSNDRLNRGHLTWLEHALIQKAKENNRSQLLLDNNHYPSEPHLSLSDKADMQVFLKEILQILPLMGLHVLEDTKPIIPKVSRQKSPLSDIIDTVVVPAHEDGFKEVFLGKNCWWAIKIASHRIDKLKYIAAYQTSPISAVTYFAPIKQIEPFGNDGKYKVIFSKNAIPIGPIPLKQAKSGLRSPLYTTFAKLKVAKTIKDL